MMDIADPTMVSLVLIAILYLPAAGVILKRGNFRERAGGLLLPYLLISSLWTLGQACSRLDWPAPLVGEVLARISLYSLPVLASLFLHLNRSFLRLEGNSRGWWAMGGIWTAAVVVFNESLLARPYGMRSGPGWILQRQALPFGVLVAGWVVFMGGATLLTARAYRRTQQPLHRNRIAYWFPALGLTIAGAALVLARRELLGSGFYLLGTLSAVYAVLTYRLPDVRQMARRTASYLVITLLAVIVYTAGFLAAQAVFQSVPGYSPLLAGATIALVLAILFDPLLHFIERLVNRRISGAGYDPSHTLREYSMNISNILDLERLATVVVGLVSEAIGIQRGALFVVYYEKGADGGENGNHCFHLRRVIGMEEDAHPGVLSAESPVADYLRREHHPLTQYDIDLLPHFRETPAVERAWLASLEMDVYVPICAQGEWIGLLALGPKVSGDCYFDDDLTLLSTLADQTAVALENARLFDDLKMRNAENERLNEELTAANRELAHLDQAKSDFIDIASHELRTPLTQVHGYNDILNEMVADGSLTTETGLQLTEVTRTAVHRLEEIVDLMFDVSQLDTETLILQASSISLASVIGTAADMWATALDERGQTLRIEGLEDLPPITADGERLKQVFSHLIQNAIKYTPDSGHIWITGRLLDEERPPQEQRVEVVVADTGIGMAPDDLERIFEKFYRVDSILSHSTGKIKFKGAGPGLGLTIARGIVEAHGGSIWAESPGYDEEIRPGSQFHVVLPVQPSRLESTGWEALLTAVRADTGPTLL